MFFHSLVASPWRSGAILAGLALAVRLAAIFVVFEDRTYFSDETNYLREAARVAEGEWLGVNTITPPGPLYAMAAGMTLGMGLREFRLVQAGLGAVVVLLTVLLAWETFGRSAALLAGAVTAVYPYLVYMSGVLYTQNQVIPLLLLIVLALYRRQRGGGRGWLFAAGVGWGTAAQFMVPSVLTAPVLALWHLARMRFRRGAADVAILTAVTVLCLVPVTIRNYALDHRFVFVSSMGSRGFYWSNNPHIDPRNRDAEKWIEVNVIRVREEKLAKGWTEAQVDSALGARAIGFIRENPRRFLGNYAFRIGTMWSPRPNPWTTNPHTGGLQFLVAALTSAPVIVLGLIALAVFAGRRRELFPFYAVPLVFTAVLAFFHTTVRYRLTFEPLLIILASALVLKLFAGFQSRRAPSTAPAPLEHP